MNEANKCTDRTVVRYNHHHTINEICTSDLFNIPYPVCASTYQKS